MHVGPAPVSPFPSFPEAQAQSPTEVKPYPKSHSKAGPQNTSILSAGGREGEREGEGERENENKGSSWQPTSSWQCLQEQGYENEGSRNFPVRSSSLQNDFCLFKYQCTLILHEGISIS